MQDSNFTSLKNHNSTQSIESYSNDNNNAFTLITFQQFVSFVKSLDLHPVIKWKSQSRKEAFDQLTQKRRIISMELQQINYKVTFNQTILLYRIH